MTKPIASIGHGAAASAAASEADRSASGASARARERLPSPDSKCRGAVARQTVTGRLRGALSLAPDVQDKYATLGTLPIVVAPDAGSAART
ncbi:hypothetical protein [Streptomyces sp. NBC_01506]|uniref:hypothetical protein n=1 Tax=Streptomyces sp. NBC_01506 TaxID=2903887 RepID=UPI00386F9137